MNTTWTSDTSNIFNFKGRDSSDFWFSCVDFKVVWDRRLSICEKMVFTIICTHVNVRTRECPLRVKTIAEEAGCSVRSVQEALKALVEYGIIERMECFENGKQKASIYRIVGHRASCYRGAYPAEGVNPENFRGAGDAEGAENDASMGARPAPIVVQFTHRGAADDTPSLRESNIYEIKDKDYSPTGRGASSPEYVNSANLFEPRSPQKTPNFSPKPSEGTDSRSEAGQSEAYRNETSPSGENLPDADDDDLIGPDAGEIPPAMRETVDYILLKTGRTGISPEELSALRALEEIHTPARVNKEIAQAAGRFGKNGRPLSSLTLVYIYKSLQYQNSLKYAQDKSPPKRDIMGEEMADPYEGCYL
jgi:DNA-binding Lrp family transcriptional regulator